MSAACFRSAVVTLALWSSGCVGDRDPALALPSSSPSTLTPPQPPAAEVTDAAAGEPTVAAWEWDGPCPVGMTLVEGGSFTQAQRDSLAERFSDENGLLVEFELEPFCLAILEVTHGEFFECIRGGQCVEGEHFAGRFLSQEGPRECVSADASCGAETAHKPVAAATFSGAEAYCGARGGRVPTLSEWFWAAMGGDENRMYPWGDEPLSDKHANVCEIQCAEYFCGAGDKYGVDEPCMRDFQPIFQGDDGYPYTAPGGRYPAGAGRWGQLDLIGNVAELVDLPYWGVGRLCGGDYRTRPAVPLELSQHVCHWAGSTRTAGIRCAAQPRTLASG